MVSRTLLATSSARTPFENPPMHTHTHTHTHLTPQNMPIVPFTRSLAQQSRLQSNPRGARLHAKLSGLIRHSDEQRKIAEAKLDEARKGGRKVELHTAPVTDVYRAEEYHQRYYAKAGRGGRF